MAKLKAGDTIECKIKDNLVVNCYEYDYDRTAIFKIIAKDGAGYCLYIPHYFFIKNCYILDSEHIKDWGIDKKFINEKCLYIKEGYVFRVDKVVDGMSCRQCGEFFHMAESNQPNGSLICWTCRTYH